MKKSYLAFLLVSLSFSPALLAQTDDLPSLSEAFSSCLMNAVNAERQKETPSVEAVKAACESQIDTFYTALGSAAASIPPLDESLQRELNKSF